jgi:hypothetical protein
MADDKQVCKILGNIQDIPISVWIDNNLARLSALSFKELMTEFRTSFLPESWEKDTCHDLLNLSMGSSSFWDFYSTSLELNSVHLTTTSYLPEDKFCHHLESCMSPKLADECEDMAMKSITEELKH